MKKEIKSWWSWVLTFVMLDQITKAWAVYSLIPDRVFPINDWFSLQLSFNVSTFMGIYDDPFDLGIVGNSIYPILYIAIGAAIAFIIHKIMKAVINSPDQHSLHMIWLKACMALILSGVIGNGLDKLWRGSVVDFIRLDALTSIQPIFNIADLAVWIGEVFVMVFLVLGVLEERRRRTLKKNLLASSI